MRKIMFMINSLYGGGAEKVLQTLLKYLDYSKYDVTLYSLHKENFDTSIYPKQVHYKYALGVHFKRFKFMRRLESFLGKVKGKVFFSCSSKLFYRLFIHEKYDVEIAFIEGESTKIISGSNNKKSKKLAWVHTDLINNPWTDFIYNSVEDEAAHYDRFDSILCVSDSVKNAFLNKYRIDENKVRTQYNPIDRDEILRMASEETTLPIKRRLRMISVGRLVEQKGFDRFLKIVSRLKSDGFDFELYILGEGEQRQLLEAYIVEHKLGDMVFMPGFQKNPYSCMKTADMIVCSSRAEGFSTVISEGVVLGLPVISTDCAGVRELFGDAECGIITKNSEDGLYDALHTVMSDVTLLEKYKAASIKKGEHFSINKTMKELGDLLDG